MAYPIMLNVDCDLCFSLNITWQKTEWDINQKLNLPENELILSFTYLQEWR